MSMTNEEASNILRLVATEAFEGVSRFVESENNRDMFKQAYEMAIKSLEESDAVERKRGHWIKQMDELAWWYECSVCGDYPLKDAYGHESLSRFCPNCGANMECFGKTEPTFGTFSEK